VETADFTLLLDAGYAVLPRLLEVMPAEQLDAVVITHGHPDHCADLNPLLRARALGGHRPPPLDVYAPPHALDAVLALDNPDMLAQAFQLHEFEPGQELAIGPFTVTTALLPHWLPNAAIRLTIGDTSLTYTGDGGPSPDLVRLARGTDLLIAEATHPDELPADDIGHLTTAAQAAAQATEAGASRLLLTHLWPGTSPQAAQRAASRHYDGKIDVTTTGLVIDLPTPE
jgi:ribonuclease BN (tRNA processing enzyme)